MWLCASTGSRCFPVGAEFQRVAATMLKVQILYCIGSGSTRKQNAQKRQVTSHIKIYERKISASVNDVSPVMGGELLVQGGTLPRSPSCTTVTYGIEILIRWYLARGPLLQSTGVPLLHFSCRYESRPPS